jgi:hypothetical protein
MRRLKLTLAVLALLALAAWGAIRLLGEPPKPPAARLPFVSEDLLADWDAIDLDLLSDQNLRIVREPGATTIRFGSNAQGQRFMFSDWVNADRLADLLLALRDSWREPLEGRPEDLLLQAGLDPPRYHLTLRRGSGAQKREEAFGFGNVDPTGHGILARCFTDGTVFRTGRQVANLLELNLSDWRSRSVFTIDPLGVSRIDLVRFHGADGKPEQITVVKEGPRTWRIEQPRSLRADPSACQSLAQQAYLLRIETFVAQEFKPEVSVPTRLPDDPDWSLQFSAEARVQELVVGAHLPDQGYACVLPGRNPTMVFTVKKETLDAILGVTADSLRPRRLFPRVEKTLVRLECREPGENGANGERAAPRWRVEREALHPRGAWKVKVPFEAKAHEGTGAGSLSQVVVELDRSEVVEFLPAGTPFRPEATIELSWRSDPILMNRQLELARDRERRRTLVRDPEQPGELFVLPERLGALIDLDLELYRDRTIFPGGRDALAKIESWRLARPGREPLEIARAKPDAPFDPVGATQRAHGVALESAANAFLGKSCVAYVRRRTVLADPSASDPFGTVAFELTLRSAEGVKETLVVSGASPAAQSPDGIYCRLRPRLPDDVWMVVPRPDLEELLRVP